MCTGSSAALATQGVSRVPVHVVRFMSVTCVCYDAALASTMRPGLPNPRRHAQLHHVPRLALPRRSWGEMLNSYRSTHGATSFATVQSGTDVPQHFPRTSLTPFGDIYHKNVHSIGADYAETRYGTEEQRHKYHGRGMNPPWMQARAA